MNRFLHLASSRFDYCDPRRLQDPDLDDVRALHSPASGIPMYSNREAISPRSPREDYSRVEELERQEDDERDVIILKNIEHVDDDDDDGKILDKEDDTNEQSGEKEKVDDEKDSRDDDKNAETFVAVIAQSILSVPTKRMTLSSIYSYIASHYPHFDKEKGPGWRNSVRHNLSSNDCFVKASRAENGKGHYWMIHPKDLPEFSKGNFRRPRKPRRPRCSQGIGCLSDRSIFSSGLGASYYMGQYSNKHPDYEYPSAFPIIPSPADVFTRGYGIAPRCDPYQRDESFSFAGYHGSSSPTYLGFPWSENSVFRSYSGLAQSCYYPYVYMSPPSLASASLLHKDSAKTKDD